MTVVQPSDRNHQVSHADIYLGHEAFLDPELLKFHLSASLYFALPFPGFLEFLLDFRSGA